MKSIFFSKNKEKNVSDPTNQQVQLKDFVSNTNVISISYQQNINPFFSIVQEVLDNSLLLSINDDIHCQNLRENSVVRCKLSKSDCEYVIDGIITEPNKSNFILTPIKIIKYQNKRTNIRLIVNLESTVIINEDESNKLNCTMLNISKSGLLLSFKEEHRTISIGNTYLFKIKSTQDFYLEFYGVIARKQKNLETHSYDFGIKFTDISAQNIKSIFTLMDN